MEKKVRMSSGQWLRMFLATVLLIGVLIGIFNYCIDPYGVFGDPILQWWSYNETMNPRGAKMSYLKEHHEEYDSYVIGSSDASAYPIEELLPACRRYYEKTSRRIHFEYAMIHGVNDSLAQAQELLALLKGLSAHVNLIPLNHVEESPLKPSTKDAVAAFQKALEDGGVTATVRRTLGSDIDASCGQLRRKYTKQTEQNN